MNRREFLGLATAAPLVAPEVVKALAEPRPLNVEALKAATAQVLKPIAHEVYTVSFLQTWTPSGKNWVYRQRMGDKLIREEIVSSLPFVIMRDNELQPREGMWFSSRKDIPQISERDAG